MFYDINIICRILREVNTGQAIPLAELVA